MKKEKYLEDLFELLRFKSISADSRYKDEMIAAAEWLREHLDKMGLDDAQVLETGGHPLVFAQKIIDPSKPTILVYGHYDVQPPDPLGLWESDPFEPCIREEKIFGRGTADDKGQVFMVLKSIEEMLAQNSLYCNVKIMIEGEEEIGSIYLAGFLERNKKLLKADVVLIADNAMLSMETPSLDVSCRGIVYYEIELTGPNRDLHSGTYGGAVENPVKILSKVLAQFHDENNRVLIPGFYDEVYELSEKEKQQMAACPFDEEDFKKDLQVEHLIGEQGFSTLERIGTRPTFEMNGIVGGYYGEGAKTVLPEKATAKVSMRLVPYQNAEAIEKQFEDYLKQIMPRTVQYKLTHFQGGNPYVLEQEHPGFKAAYKAIQQTFGKGPVVSRGGGSIPIVADFEQILGVKSVFLGFGLHNDNLHSPNEKFDLFNFYKGIETFPYFFKYFSEAFE